VEMEEEEREMEKEVKKEVEQDSNDNAKTAENNVYTFKYQR
jgi:hypothetical protein